MRRRRIRACVKCVADPTPSARHPDPSLYLKTSTSCQGPKNSHNRCSSGFGIAPYKPSLASDLPSRSAHPQTRLDTVGGPQAAESQRSNTTTLGIVPGHTRGHTPSPCRTPWESPPSHSAWIPPFRGPKALAKPHLTESGMLLIIHVLGAIVSYRGWGPVKSVSRCRFVQGLGASRGLRLPYPQSTPRRHPAHTRRHPTPPRRYPTPPRRYPTPPRRYPSTPGGTLLPQEVPFYPRRYPNYEGGTLL